MFVLLLLHSDEKPHSLWQNKLGGGKPSTRFTPRVSHTAVARGGKLVSFSVLLTPPSVHKVVLERTWASGEKGVQYFVTSAEDINAITGDESITVLRPDFGYPLLALMKVVCRREWREVRWHAVVHGSTYIKTREVANLLRRMHSADTLLLGHCQTFHSWENSVPSEMGFIVSRGLMATLCPSLWQCGKEQTLRPTEELGVCIQAVTGVRCSEV